jgi:site-specific DNA-methyltransferase (adenine-specific)
LIVHADSFGWLEQVPEGSIHGIVTDPPYGVKEFEHEQLAKRASGKGGVWRIPPALGGCVRAPLPRFTALNASERRALRDFFAEWGRLACRVLRPGGHVFVAGNAYLSQLVWTAISEGGLEFRGEIIRLVMTLRGGDRPKNAHEEFDGVTVMPRGCYEPWGLFRKPLPAGMTVADCLRAYGTGGLRRASQGRPFCDVFFSERTPRRERALADHPSLKPQSFLRPLVRAVLPLGVGVIADPFMGSGSTLAASNAVGLSCVGAERMSEYYEMAKNAIPALAKLPIHAQPGMAVADYGDEVPDGKYEELRLF